MQVIKLRAHTGSNLISEQESQNGHESVFSMKMKCCLLAAAAKPQSSSLLQTQRKSRQLQNCRVLSGRQCPSDIQVYTFAARGIHPALYSTGISSITHKISGYLLQLCYFLCWLERCAHLSHQSCEPTTLAPCTSYGEGLSAHTMLRDRACWWYWKARRQATAKASQNKQMSSGNDEATLKGSKNSALQHLRSAWESEVQLHGNALGFLMGQGSGSKALNAQ